MAPSKSTKRGDAKGAAPPAAKKPRADPNLAGVVEALEQAADLPEACRKMLLAGLPFCFAAPCEERHETQAAAVRMIGEVIQGVETALQSEADEESGKVVEVEASKAELQASAAGAEEARAAAGEVVTIRTAVVAEAATAVAAARTRLQEAEEAQRSGDAGLLEAQLSKAALERGIEVDLRAILEGQGEPESHFQALLPLLGGLGLDESLEKALPSTCKKQASERGPFDTMVLEQLGSCLKERVALLARTIEAATPAARERAVAVEAAQAELAAATEAQGKASEDLEAAKAGQQAATEKAAAAAEAVEAFEPGYAQATQLRDEKAAALENFRLYNVACFTQLRDQASPQSAGGA